MLQLTVLNGGVLSEKFNQDCQTLPPPTMAIFSETVPKKHVQGFAFLSTNISKFYSIQIRTYEKWANVTGAKIMTSTNQQNYAFWEKYIIASLATNTVDKSDDGAAEEDEQVVGFLLLPRVVLLQVLFLKIVIFSTTSMIIITSNHHLAL